MYLPSVLIVKSRLLIKQCFFFQVNHVIAVSSGTAAIHAGLVALGIGKGYRVAVPAICAVMTVLPVIQLGAIPPLLLILKGIPSVWIRSNWNASCKRV